MTTTHSVEADDGPELCVAWVGFTMSETSTLTREQVVTAARARGVSTPSELDFATTRSFVATAERLRHEYVDDFGRAWVVVAEPSKTRSDASANAVVLRVPVRGDGERLKLAELSCRKKSIRHPLELRTTLRKNLTAPDRAAVRAWVKVFEKSWTESELEPTVHVLKRITRAALIEADAWPASRGRLGMWFVYADRAGRVDAMLDLLAEALPTLDGACMPVRATPAQVAMAGELCDEFLAEQAQALLRTVRKDVDRAHAYQERVTDPHKRKIGGRPRESRLNRYVEQVVGLLSACSFHEERLRTEMSTTRQWCHLVLDACEELPV